jgi:hypothetical protein
MGKWIDQFSKEVEQMANKYMKKFNIKEMWIKITLRLHLTLTRTATIKKTNNNKYWSGCGEKRTLIHTFWWEYKLVSMEIPQKTKNRITIWSCYTIPGHLPEEM